ncbi:hypothetical protein V8F20_006900 [Naviculisporaceae sp. PSN 640]
MLFFLWLLWALAPWVGSVFDHFRPSRSSRRSGAANNATSRTSFTTKATRLIPWIFSVVTWLFATAIWLTLPAWKSLIQTARSHIHTAMGFLYRRLSLALRFLRRLLRRSDHLDRPPITPSITTTDTVCQRYWVLVRGRKFLPWRISFSFELRISPASPGDFGTCDGLVSDDLTVEDWLESPEDSDKRATDSERQHARKTMAELPREILPVELDYHLRDLAIPGSFGKKLLKKAMKIFCKALFETARDHWPNAFKIIDDEDGDYLVEPTYSGFKTFLAEVSPEELDLVSPDALHLKDLLFWHVRPVRNRVEHPRRYYFNNSSAVDLDLRVIEMAILLMNRRDRASQVRDLWNQLVNKASEVAIAKTKRLLELSSLIGANPNYDMSDEDLEYLHQFDYDFYKVITGQERPGEEYKVPESNPYLRVGRFYVKQRREKGRKIGPECTHYVEHGYEFW